jgi:hypothetical protein
LLLELLETSKPDFFLAQWTLILLAHPHLDTFVVKVVPSVAAERSHNLAVFKLAQTD